MVELQSRSDWKTVNDCVTQLHNTLARINKSKWPKTDLVICQQETKALLAAVEKFSISRIGQVNVKRELLAVQGTLLAVKTQTDEEGRRIQEYFPQLQQTAARLQSIQTEVTAKIDNEIYSTPLDESIESAEKYNDLPQAMKEAIKQLGKENTDADAKTNNRDIVQIAHIVDNNKRDLARMKSTINNHFVPNDPENFTILKGPIITNAALDENRLQDSNIDYDIVYFPGVQYTFTRREAVPRMYVLRDQILVAVKLDAAKSRFQLKLNKKRTASTIETRDARFEQLREELISTMSSKLHVELVDVLEQKSHASYIVNPEFPGIRFLWFIRASVYKKLGPFSPGSQVGMPF